MRSPQPPREIAEVFRRGGVIPAHPVALTEDLALDERRHRALSRYYIDAGAIGLAVAVHPSSPRMHEPRSGLLEPVLALTMETARDWKKDQLLVMIAGIAGKTAQAAREAELARGLGYHIGLLDLSALRESSEDRLLAHCAKVAEIMPIVGSYPPVAQGGRALSEEFWHKLSETPNLVGVRVAPSDRYRTLDVVAGVARSSRAREVALYTGNEDSFVTDLVTPYVVDVDGSKVRKEFVGGILGHWSFWTKRATEIHRETKKQEHENRVPRSLFTLASQVTEASEAISDPRGGHAGWTSGILYVLARSGLVAGVYSPDPDEKLSPGQAERIERVISAYPGLTDDSFVADHRERWLSS